MKRSSWWLLCFGWTHDQLRAEATRQYSHTEFAVLLTGWLMTAYSVVAIALAVWLL